MSIVNSTVLYPQKFIERVDLMLNVLTTKSVYCQGNYSEDKWNLILLGNNWKLNRTSISVILPRGWGSSVIFCALPSYSLIKGCWRKIEGINSSRMSRLSHLWIEWVSWSEENLRQQIRGAGSWKMTKHVRVWLSAGGYRQGIKGIWLILCKTLRTLITS